jgi:hypothetical protein
MGAPAEMTNKSNQQEDFVNTTDTRGQDRLPRSRRRTFSVVGSLAAIALGGAAIAQSQAAVHFPALGPAVHVGIKQVPPLVRGIKIFSGPLEFHGRSQSSPQSGAQSLPNPPPGRCVSVDPGATNVALPSDITVHAPAVAIVFGFSSGDCKGLPIAATTDKLAPSLSPPAVWFIGGKWHSAGAHIL